MRDTVRRPNTRRAGVVVIELPGSDRAVIAHAAFDVDHTGRTKICPGKFLLASPYQLDWLSCSLRESGSFERGIGGVLTAICRAGIRNQDSHLLDRNPKCFI